MTLASTSWQPIVAKAPAALEACYLRHADFGIEQLKSNQGLDSAKPGS
jgi:hypothetical protein